MIEVNELCKQIEIAFRNDNDSWKIRYNSVSAELVFKTLVKHKIGMQCDKCIARKLKPVKERTVKKDLGLNGEVFIEKGYYGEQRMDREPYYQNGGKFCSPEHSAYYRAILNQFYLCPSPNSKDDNVDYSAFKPKICPLCGNKIDEFSKDHIIPVASGGLEFDRNNVQWACLKCNIKKSGGKVYDNRIKQKALHNKD